jgi:hypothetical protein
MVVVRDNSKRDTSNEWHGRGVNLAIISITFSSVAACLVGVRLASRFDYNRKKVKGIGGDDVAIVGSLVSASMFSRIRCDKISRTYNSSALSPSPLPTVSVSR